MTTEPEKLIVRLLAEAWQAYLKLPVEHPSEQTEFMHGIHRCQDIIGMRVARRADPATWGVVSERMNRFIGERKGGTS